MSDNALERKFLAVRNVSFSYRTLGDKNTSRIARQLAGIELSAKILTRAEIRIKQTPNTVLGPNLGLLDTSQAERNIQFALKLYY